MNAISKRLLSWLVVAAMVLSMVPALNLSNFAIETNAAAGDANYAGLSIDEHLAKNNIAQNDSDIEGHVTAGTCPMCGAEGITWTEVTSASTFPLAGKDGNHFVVSGEFGTNNKNFVTATGAACVALKGDANVTIRKVYVEGTSAVLNIMGTGKLYADNQDTDAPTFEIQKGIVNLYGGTYTHRIATTTSVKSAAVVVLATANATCNVYSAATIGPEDGNTAAALNVYGRGGKLNMYGGTIRNGMAFYGKMSGNVYLINGSEFNMYGGTVRDGGYLSGMAVNNSNFYIANVHVRQGKFNMYGGTISGGNTGNNLGGGVFASADSINGSTTTIEDAVINLYGGKIIGGNGIRGGNLGVYKGKLNISGTALIENGVATGRGGNLYMASSAPGVVNISGGYFRGGQAPDGGNIYAYTDNANAKLTISGGQIYDGVSSGNGANIYLPNGCKMDISGGTIVGDIYMEGAYSTVKLSGKPQILKSYGNVTANNYGLKFASASMKVDISELEPGANICVSAPFEQLITKENSNAAAAGIVDCFFCYNEAHDVTLAESGNYLQIGVNKDTFAPDQCGGLAYCPACIAQGVEDADTTPVAWTAYTGSYGELAANMHHHLYLAADQTQDTGKFFILKNDATKPVQVCFNLNGHTITANEGAKVTFYVKNKLSLMDTDPQNRGQVIANRNGSDTGAAVQVNGGSTCYIYGGTYTNKGTSPVVKLDNENLNKLYLYDGAVIDGNTTARAINLAAQSKANAEVHMEGGTIQNGSAANGGNILISQGTFYMNGGTIQNGSATTTGGNIQIVTGDFTMVNGTIQNGNAPNAGNVLLGNGNFVMTGGTITDGNAISTAGGYGRGGNVFVQSGGVFTMSGTAKVTEGEATDRGGNMYITSGASGVININGGEVYGGEAKDGGNIYAYTDQADAMLTVAGGKIYNGYATNFGGNILVSDGGNCKITITGGEIYGGIADVEGGNIYQYGSTVVNISGGTIVGDWYVRTSSSVVKASGAPQIVKEHTVDGIKKTASKYGMLFNGTAKITLEDNMSPAASFCVSGVTNQVIASGTNATEAIAKQFSSYDDSLMIRAVDNALKLVQRAAVVSKDSIRYFDTNQEAVDHYVKGSYVRLNSNDAITINGELYIDNISHEMQVNGEGTLYAIDSGNNDFVGYGGWLLNEKVTAANDVINPVNGDRYVVIKMGEKYYSFYIEVALTEVSLRPGVNPSEADFSQPGMYYTAQIKCHPDLAKRISTYGVALSVEEQPGANLQRLDVSYTAKNFTNNYDEATKSVTGNSCLLYNILKESADDNNDRIKTNVYANAYFKVNVGDREIIVADNANAACSMYDILKYVDSNWESYKDQHDVINGFYSYWSTKGGLNLADDLNIIA